MSWGAKEKKVKRVSVEFEYSNFHDLRLVLARLSALLMEGNESYLEFIKDAENEEKSNVLKFSQEYVNTERESIEREINGKLKLVIKSNI
jgi:Ser-tRNA(Ala) deacylase AlaX